MKNETIYLLPVPKLDQDINSGQNFLSEADGRLSKTVQNKQTNKQMDQNSKPNIFKNLDIF